MDLTSKEKCLKEFCGIGLVLWDCRSTIFYIIIHSLQSGHDAILCHWEKNMERNFNH